MTYHVCLNIKKMVEWDISSNSAIMMGIFSDLESWANKDIVEVAGVQEIYYRLYVAKILEDVPVFGSRSSVGRCIKELEDKGLIDSINKKTRKPGYRLTEKGMTWKRNPNSSPNDYGENISHGKTKEKDFFHLDAEVEYRSLTETYKQKLHQVMLELCDEHKIEKTEINQFVLKNDARGAKYKNWKSAFRTWIGFEKKFEKKRRISEAEKDGLYQ